MLQGSESPQFAFCGLSFPSNIERFILIDRDCSVSFSLLSSIVVHEYPAVLFIQLLMGRYLGRLHMVSWAFMYASPLGHGRLSLGPVCNCGMVRWKACPNFLRRAESVYTFHQPHMSVSVASFLPQHLVFSHFKFFASDFLWRKTRFWSLHLLAASTSSLSPLSCPKAVILMHLRIAKKAG